MTETLCIQETTQPLAVCGISGLFVDICGYLGVFWGLSLGNWVGILGGIWGVFFRYLGIGRVFDGIWG